MTHYRPTWAEISTDAFALNVRRLKQWVGDRVGLLAVLKADAYGHGASALAKLALENGASAIGVSSLEEGIALREAKIAHPILILGGIYPLENFSIALQSHLTPTVASLESAQFLAETARRNSRTVSFHMKVDTGMGRIGSSVPAARKLLAWLKDQITLRLEGVYSHLACADSDPDFTREQLQSFEGLKNYARELGFSDTVFHIANSAAALLYRESHHEMVRPGLSLYGISPVASQTGTVLSPVLSWHSRIVFLKRVSGGTSISYGKTFVTKRDSDIATLPVGYADGVPRSLSNKGFVLIKGKRCPIVGRVTMDHLMVDVTGAAATVGEAVVLIGTQGEEKITVHDWASWAGTISYEILCGVSKRVPRVLV